MQHLLTFVQGLNQWLKVFEGYADNLVLNELIAPIKQHLKKLDCLEYNSNNLKKDPQAVLQLGYFFHYQFKVLADFLRYIGESHLKSS